MAATGNTLQFGERTEKDRDALANPQAKPVEKQASVSFLVFVNIGMVLAGTLTTIFGKILD